jgi:peptide-methionine (S)-S-oxide reductase
MKIFYRLLFMTAALLSPLSASTSSQQAVFGGGCFWCLEALFKTLPGVTKVTSGFAGGLTKNPTYEQVCSGETGHAEVIEVTYDPQKISYDRLLDFFWKVHDPTTLNRQGADRGTQYRSIILTRTPEEQRLAEHSKKRAQADFKSPIVTEIGPLVVFYPADISHQDYYRNHPDAPYCRAVIAPKLEKIGKLH